MEEKRFGLIGRHLSHSYSKKIHEDLFSYGYDHLEVEEDEISNILNKDEYGGFNITIPYKETVLGLCHSLSPQAAKLKNVNTIVKKDEKLIGHNTDYGGFEALLHTNNIDVSSKLVCILGNGGAAKTASQVVEDLGAKKIIVLARNSDVKFDQIDKFKDAHIIINATPVGMYPNNGKSLVNLEDFDRVESVVDMIYNPSRTRLILDANELGIQAVNGLGMLIYQAKLAGEIFTNENISDEKYQKTLEKIEKSMLNIALIGMPGVGKTTYAKKLASQSGSKIYSTDALIEEKMGKSCKDIIRDYGEDYFRKIETQVLEEISKESNGIIDCGGGIVTRDENYDLLAQNSTIYWLRRDVKNLSTKDRPLSEDEGIEKLYQKRKDLYDKWSDKKVDL